jgi:ribonuclease R
MEDKIGNEYEGIITSITSFGMFIEIDKGIEGLFLYRDANRYYYYYDKENSCESSGNIYHVGDKVNIIVRDADRENRCIYFSLKDDYNDRGRRKYFDEDYM